MINLTTLWIYVTHDSQLCIKSKKFTGIFNNKLNKRCFLAVVKQGREILKVHFMRKNLSWKEFAQTGREKVCDKVKINKLG
jgi:hypothetical protein